jgi:hypothetical protein
MISKGVQVTFVNTEHNYRCMLDVKCAADGI